MATWYRPVGAQAADPAVGLQHDLSHTVPGADLAHAGGIGAHIPVEEIALAVKVHQGTGQEALQILAHTSGAAGGTAAAVGSGEGLVQVEEAHIKAGVPSAGDAQQAVGIGLVVSAQAALGVDVVHKFLHVAVVHAGVLGVGHDVTGGALGDRCLQLLQIGQTGDGVRLEVDDLEAGHGRSGGIGGMGVDGGDDLVPVLSLILEVGADQAGHGEDTLGAAAGLEGKAVHAGDLTHIAVGLIEDLQQALDGALVLERMVVLNEAGQLVVDLGAVLHGAGALADLNIHIGAQGLLGQTGVVAQYPVLGHLRQIDRSAPGHAGGDGGKAVAYLLGYLSAGLGTRMPRSPGVLSS